MQKITKVMMPLVILALLSMTVTIVNAQSVGPNKSTTSTFSPSENVSDSISWSGGISLFGLGADVSAAINVFSGVSLPFEVTVTYPEWVDSGSSFTTAVSAQGKSGGSIGLDFSASLDITLNLGFLTWDLIDETISLDLSADFITPIGSEVSSPLTNEIRIAGVDIPLIGEVAAYFGVVAQATLEGVLSSSISITGSSLTSPWSDNLDWDYQGETHSKTLGTASTGSSPVSVNLNDITLSMTDLIISISSVYLEFRLAGLDPYRLSLPLPDLFSASTGADAEYGGYSVGPLSIPMRSAGLPGFDVLGEIGGIGLVVIAGAVALIIVGVVLTRRKTGTH